MKPPKNSDETGRIGPAANVFPDHVALGRKNESSKISTVFLILATPFVLLAVLAVWLREKLANIGR